jgi:catechol 2,3-dioxygenase-like lactoylglutathione lyase family enzyme
MIRRVTHVSLLVHNQQEALRWYTEKLGFEKRADDPFPDSEGRWITIAPKEQPDLQFVLQPPEWGIEGDVESRRAMVGKSPGWVLLTDNIQRDYEEMQSRGVEFIRPPEEEPWGTSAVFVDLYGTAHNLLEPRDFGYASRE